MEIVVLDGYCLNPGDLSWAELHQLGNVTIYDRTPANKTIERAKNAEIVLTNKTILNAENMSQLPKLRYIGVLATGYNVVDLQYTKQHNIVVTNIPAYGTASVAQMVFALLLNITNSVDYHSQLVHNGEWCQCNDFCFWERNQIELSGKTMGLVGLGNTGMATAQIALAFGMKVLAVTSKTTLPNGIVAVDLSTLLQQSDVISLHCPLCDNTKHIINRATINLMKHSAIVINTGRGPLVDEQALAEALNTNRIMAAAVDVLSTEPPQANNPLLLAKNCYITPHIAWATIEARQRLMQIAINNVNAFINGLPINVVSA